MQSRDGVAASMPMPSDRGQPFRSVSPTGQAPQMPTAAAALLDCADEAKVRYAAAVDRVCEQRGWLPGRRVPTYDPLTATACWCECGRQPGIPLLATPDGERSANALGVGHLVMAAGLDLAWSPVPVRFSAGAEMGGATALIRIRSASETAESFAALPDQTFLTRARKLIRARDLRSGDDLLRADGAAMTVLETNIQDYRGSVWSIATSDERPRGLENHLLNSSGVVSGDYAVQLFFDSLAQSGLAERAKPHA